MPAAKMHENEVEVTDALVRRLLGAQFPPWADRPLRRVESSGTDHALYRLGPDLAVRLPRIHSAIGQVAKEYEWLPRLAPFLPLAIPVPAARGEPGEGYPFAWAVYGWLGGENAAVAPVADPRDAAVRLGRFVAALQALDLPGGPAPGRHNFFRGVPLADRDESVRERIEDLRDDYDTGALTAAWEESLAAPVWDRPGVWLHGDLHATNLLVTEGTLTAAIDWGGMGVGDPACDLMPAWSFLPPEARAAFRAELRYADDATWLRSRGWALSMGIMALPYYRHTNPGLVSLSRVCIGAALADLC
ncbi:MAG TPA: aminoglycoside phosphotransferase family protein [Frankiaceae bacterium]|nr:aminoglycoside phosphotransferase family protein [Frankiaceae bacterium]